MVSLAELHEAFLFVSGDIAGDHEAYLDRATGHIYYTGSLIDEEAEDLPDDLDDAKYISVPGQHELDLGHRVVFGFVEEAMPNAYEQVREIFSRRGAYSRFKDFLNRAGQLDAWYRYEEEATLRALRAWCEENEIEFSESQA